MRSSRIFGIAVLVVALAACGKTAPLEPAEGRSLPPAPYGAKEKLSAEELYTPSSQARPTAEDELLRRSERREIDPFDLPPGYTPPEEEPEDTPSVYDPIPTSSDIPEPE